jgi:ketosteroid isomerase-like protein
MNEAVAAASDEALAAFAKEWLDAWNAHDLERILALYEQEFEFC